MLTLKRLAWLKAGAPPRNVVEAALRAKWGGGGASYEKTVGPAPIISISDAKAKPAKSLVVGMEPVQDLHGYDSPWPAGGGKNLCPPFIPTSDTGLTVTANSDGSLSVSGTATASGYITEFATLAQTIPSGTAFVISIKNTVTTRIRAFFDQGVADIFEGRTSSASITNSADVTKVRLYLFLTEGTSYNFTIYFQLELGSTATSWTPYSNECPISGRTGVTVDHSGADTSDPQTYHVMFPDGQTVYGGTVDVVSGVLTVTHGLHSFTGDEYWSFAQVSGHYRAYTNAVPIANYSGNPVTITDKILCCNLFPIVSWGTIYNGELGCGQTGQYVGFGMDAIGISVESDWRDYLRNNTISLVYELATPQTFQLTPQQIQLLKGANVLWSDANALTLTYLGTTPANLLGGMLGGGYTPPEEETEEEEQVPEEEQAEESDPEEVIPDGES